MAKSFLTPDHHTHIWAYPNLLPQYSKHRIVQEVLVCCGITISLYHC